MSLTRDRDCASTDRGRTKKKKPLFLAFRQPLKNHFQTSPKTVFLFFVSKNIPLGKLFEQLVRLRYPKTNQSENCLFFSYPKTYRLARYTADTKKTRRIAIELKILGKFLYKALKSVQKYFAFALLNFDLRLIQNRKNAEEWR